MIEIIDKKDCCGCTSCFNICPRKCITMEEDEEGFIYPQVDKSVCVDCKLCEIHCPILKKTEVVSEVKKAYVAINKDEEIRRKSTSGGAVYAIIKYIISEMNGYAAGVIYDDNYYPKHVLTKNLETAKQFCGSKYAQSDLSSLFLDIKERLKNREFVVFVGTPCQVAGLKTFLGEDTEYLYLIDIVCRSIPSKKLWKKYLEWQEQKYQSNIIGVNCRNKTYGYHNGSLTIDFENGKRYSGSNRVDLYMKSFHSDICSRYSCYDCQFKTLDRMSDFTIFDSWKAEYVSNGKYVDDNTGCSNIVAHSKKAVRLINEQTEMTVFDADINKMIQFTGGMETNSILYKEERNIFYKEIEKKGFEKGVKSFIKVSFKDKIIETIKPLYFGIRN